MFTFLPPPQTVSDGAVFLVNILDRLAELGWHPFKADSKIQLIPIMI